jgi:hypothetical protein
MGRPRGAAFDPEADGENVAKVDVDGDLAEQLAA